MTSDRLYRDEMHRQDIGDVRLVYGDDSKRIILQSFDEEHHPTVTAAEARQLAAALLHMAEMIEGEPKA